MSAFSRRALIVAAIAATSACTIHDTEPPPLNGPSGLALTLTVTALPDTINQDGGSQSSIKVTAVGPDGRGMSSLPIRMDMRVNGVAQDFGTLSARNIVTGTDGTASVIFTAPPRPTNGVFGTCNGLAGNCVSIVATASGSNFVTANPGSVDIRLVPTGVILPPAQGPTPSFTFAPSSPLANSPVQFDASGSCGGPLVGGACPASAPGIDSFSWNFGDGQTATGQTTSHSFALQQTYTVTLTVTSSSGASASRSQVVTVGSGALPTPTFTFSPTAPGVGEIVFFSGLGSTPGQGHTITSYRWTFGDGATASGSTVSHAFGAAGTYAVQLTVTDESGQSATSAAQTVSVGAPPTPTANFTISPAQPAVGDVVILDWRTSTTAQGQRIVSLDWNFGDGTPIVHCPGSPDCTADGITTHVYQAAGTYAINLVVTDSAGRTSAKSQSITIFTGNPIPSCAANPASVSPGGLVQLDAGGTVVFSGATITSYSWNFGDPGSGALNTSTLGPTTTHNFVGIGSHGVTVSVVDSRGRQGSGTCTVTVTP